jgi:steroid delta-isomerase-like uncharacterized protein
MSLEENKNLGRRFLVDIWSQGKMEVADEILAPDFVMELGVDPFRVEGPEKFKSLVARNRSAFQNLTYTPIEDRIAAEGDNVFIAWTMTSKHVGSWAGYTPSNKDVRIQGISYFKCRDGKLTHCWVQNETLSLIRQVGGLPPVGQGTEYKILEANKALVRQYVEAVLDKGDFSHFSQFTAPGFHIERSAAPDLIRGGEGLKTQMDFLKRAFPDLHVQIADMIAEGDKVLVRFEAPGTHTGEFLGIPPTGKKVTWKGLVLYRVADGLIAEAWANWDDVGLQRELQQLGLGSSSGQTTS